MCAAPIAKQCAASSSATNAFVSHVSCRPGTCGVYEDLSHYLPSFPRSAILGYLSAERVTYFPSCAVFSVPSLPPHPLTHLGWKPSQCTEGAIRDLIVEKMISVVADASRRMSAYKINLSVLNMGFWYANEYYHCLKEARQLNRIEFFKKRNAFFHGHPPRGFSQVRNPVCASGIQPSCYQLNMDVLPSEGLMNCRTTLCMMDCQDVIELAYYEALLEIMGETRFNAFFRANGPFPLSFNVDIAKTPLRPFLIGPSLGQGQLGARPVEPGDFAFFANIPLYSVKHQEGEWAGFHVCCLQSGKEQSEDGQNVVQKYIGFGAPSAGITENQIIESFIEEFNGTPILRSAIYNAELINAQVSQDNRLGPLDQEAVESVMKFNLTKEVFEKAQSQQPDRVGFVATHVRRPNFEFIRKIVSS